MYDSRVLLMCMLSGELKWNEAICLLIMHVLYLLELKVCCGTLQLE